MISPHCFNGSRFLGRIPIACLLALGCLLEPNPCLRALEPPAPLDNPFFAFDNGVGRGTWGPEEQADVLGALKYDGMGYTGVGNIAHVAKAFESRGMKLFSTYLKVDLEAKALAYDAGLPDAIRQLKGHDTALWLHLHGKKDEANSLDEQGVRILREISDMAQASKLPVVLYPHTGFYVATTRDAVRLARKTDRANVGVSFNLCHFLKQHDEKSLRDTLKEAAPHLRLVSINGTDRGNTRAMGWDRLIQPLGRGDFDMPGFLKMLQEINYQGPIGLQCYNIPDAPRIHLKQSITAWKRLTKTP